MFQSHVSLKTQVWRIWILVKVWVWWHASVIPVTRWQGQTGRLLQAHSPGSQLGSLEKFQAMGGPVG